MRLLLAPSCPQRPARGEDLQTDAIRGSGRRTTFSLPRAFWRPCCAFRQSLGCSEQQASVLGASARVSVRGERTDAAGAGRQLQANTLIHVAESGWIPERAGKHSHTQRVVMGEVDDGNRGDPVPPLASSRSLSLCRLLCRQFDRVGLQSLACARQSVCGVDVTPRPPPARLRRRLPFATPLLSRSTMLRSTGHAARSLGSPAPLLTRRAAASLPARLPTSTNPLASRSGPSALARRNASRLALPATLRAFSTTPRSRQAEPVDQELDFEGVERVQDEVDVCIVGGGPAGLSAAIQLMKMAQEKGEEIRVVVLEKGAEIGSFPVHGPPGGFPR